jgi:CSLREA domain-containing protein
VRCRIGSLSVTRLARSFGSLLVAIPLALGALSPDVAVFAATTITVTTTADEQINNGNCSLREAIRAADLDEPVDVCSAGSGADTIVVPAGNYQLLGQLSIGSDVVIRGAGREAVALVGSRLVNRTQPERVIHILRGAHVVLEGLFVRDGLPGPLRPANLGGGPTADGGGILNFGTLTVVRSFVSGNIRSVAPVFSMTVVN